MKKNIFPQKPEGIGGWLILFQVRIFVGAGILFAVEINVLLAAALVIMMILCLTLFYKRCIEFRIIYIISALAALAMCVAKLPENAVLFAVQTAAEAVVITALFLSKRVKLTFFRSERDVRIDKERNIYGELYNLNRTLR
jgi:hypothetical protein